MREIEIKARVENIADIIQALQDDGQAVSELVVQRDQVFGLPGEEGADNNHQPWLRIRTETKNENTLYLFTLKKSVTNQLDSIEHETEVTDASELDRIIHHIGFEPYSDLTKTRCKAKVGDIEICIDVVDGLGEFVEAEKLTDEDADYETTVAELWQVLERYGVDRTNQVTDGYDVMMKKQQKENG
jgi:adenylate cyclase, class 2